VKNIATRIAKLEARKSNPMIGAVYQMACRFAQDQRKTAPEKPRNLVEAFKQGS